MEQAVRFRRTDMVKDLLAAKADPNPDALHCAAYNQSTKTVQLLLAAAADPNRCKGNLLRMAAGGGWWKIVNLLLEKGVDPNGDGALHEATKYRHTDIVESLLQKAADVNAMDNHGETPLHAAVFQGLSPGAVQDMVQLLLDNRADPNVPTKRNNKLLLHYAAAAGNVDMVDRLLRHGADPKHVWDTVTPLHMAASRGCTRVVELLLVALASPDVADGYGDTPLHAAAVSATGLHTARLLLMMRADPNKPNNMGVTPLHTAAARDHGRAMATMMLTDDALSRILPGTVTQHVIAFLHPDDVGCCVYAL